MCSLLEVSEKLSACARFWGGNISQTKTESDYFRESSKINKMVRTLRMTKTFFVGPIETTMASMTEVRSMLPARLRTARLATIAQDAELRRFFASGDDSTTIRGILREWHATRRDVRRMQALHRRLMREARSRRAMAGARQRRERAQQVAHALAPVVQEVSRGQRLANRQARLRAVN